MLASRIILHIDMDSFFSSVEARENPELKGKPVVVGADPKGGKGRGVVSTCSYEARKYGIRSGMPISRAYRLNPNAAFLPVNMELYRGVSKRVMGILRRHAGKFQQVSIDEAYLDVSTKVKDYREAEALARRIKQEIMRREELTCSIGIAPNKLVAKIASDMRKPDGLTVVKPGDVEKFLSPLPVRRIPGVGPKTEAALEEMGVRTIGELAKMDVQRLRTAFGKWGGEMHRLAQGIDDREVEEKTMAKSIGRETTFEEDTGDEEEIHKTLRELAEKVQREAVKEGYLYRTITLKVRLEDFSTYTRSRTLEHHTTSLEALKEVAQDLVKEFLGGDRKIRLLGVRVSGLAKPRQKQKTLREYALQEERASPGRWSLFFEDEHVVREDVPRP